MWRTFLWVGLFFALLWVLAALVCLRVSGPLPQDSAPEAHVID